MWTLNKKNVSFGLNQINGYLRKGLRLERFDPSRRLIELRFGSTLVTFLMNFTIVM